LGAWLKGELEKLAGEFPKVIRRAKGLGFMLGIELAEKESIRGFARQEPTAAVQMVQRLHGAGLLTVPAGPQVIRMLPPLNLGREEAAEAVAIIRKVLERL
jgi:acetylornithine/succinyldiaminopimelate/putrescine aminotransferase